MGDPVSQGEEVEEETARQDEQPESMSNEEDEGKEQREPALIMEMLFREAEVIAQNLKESGTRR